MARSADADDISAPPPSVLPPSVSPSSMPAPSVSPSSAPLSAPSSAPFGGWAPGQPGYMSTHAKMSLAEVAMQLRDDQLRARVVLYKAHLETSPELDAVTARVVAELRQLRRVARTSSRPPPTSERADIEIELIGSLKEMLARLFKRDHLAGVIERKLIEFSRRFARLFFESELHEKIRGSRDTTQPMVSAEQALYGVLARNELYLVAELEALEYAGAGVLAEAKEQLSALMQELRDRLLGRSTPELNALLKVLHEVLLEFFTRELPAEVGELAWEVVREARLADTPARAEYTVPAEAFPRFRQTFERSFVRRLVAYAGDELVRRIEAESVGLHAEASRFFANPQLFSGLCELICDAIYDFLYTDGFLDLPPDWRACVACP